MLDPFPLPKIFSSLAFQILRSPVFFSSTSPAMCYVSSATQSCFDWPSDAGFPVFCSRDKIPESCHHSGSFNHVLRTPKLVSGLQHFLLSFTYVPLPTSCLLGYLASEMSDIVTVHLSTWKSLSPRALPPPPPRLPPRWLHCRTLGIVPRIPHRVCLPNSSHMPLSSAHF